MSVTKGPGNQATGNATHAMAMDGRTFSTSTRLANAVVATVNAHVATVTATSTIEPGVDYPFSPVGWAEA